MNALKKILLSLNFGLLTVLPVQLSAQGMTYYRATVSTASSYMTVFQRGEYRFGYSTASILTVIKATEGALVMYGMDGSTQTTISSTGLSVFNKGISLSSITFLDGSAITSTGVFVSTWVGKATSGLDMGGYAIVNSTGLILTSGGIRFPDSTVLTSTTGFGGGGSVWVATATSNLNMDGYAINNVSSITVFGSVFVGGASSPTIISPNRYSMLINSMFEADRSHATQDRYYLGRAGVVARSTWVHESTSGFDWIYSEGMHINKIRDITFDDGSVMTSTSQFTNVFVATATSNLNMNTYDITNAGQFFSPYLAAMSSGTEVHTNFNIKSEFIRFSRFGYANTNWQVNSGTFLFNYPTSHIVSFLTGGTDRFRIDGSAGVTYSQDLRPIASGSSNLGHSTVRWNGVFANTLDATTLNVATIDNPYLTVRSTGIASYQPHRFFSTLAVGGAPFGSQALSVVNGSFSVGFNATNRMSLYTSAGVSYIDSIGDSTPFGAVAMRIGGSTRLYVSSWNVVLSSPLVVSHEGGIRFADGTVINSTSGIGVPVDTTYFMRNPSTAALNMASYPIILRENYGSIDAETSSTTIYGGGSGVLHIGYNSGAAAYYVGSTNFQIQNSYLGSPWLRMYTAYPSRIDSQHFRVSSSMTIEGSGGLETPRIAFTDGTVFTSTSGIGNWVGKAASDLDMSSYGIKNAAELSVNGYVAWTGGRVWYVPLSSSIATAIANATAGDTLILAAGTYTITSAITINKALTIRGQGRGRTFIYTTSAAQILLVNSSNVVVSDMLLHGVYSGAVETRGIANSAGPWSGVLIDRVNVVAYGSTGEMVGFSLGANNATVRDCDVLVEQGATGTQSVYGIQVSGSSVWDNTANIIRSNIRAFGNDRFAFGVGSYRTNTTTTTINIYDCDIYGGSNGGTAYGRGLDLRGDSGAAPYANVYGGRVYGHSVDVNGNSAATDPGKIRLFNTVLYGPTNITTTQGIVSSGTAWSSGGRFYGNIPYQILVGTHVASTNTLRIYTDTGYTAHVKTASGSGLEIAHTGPALRDPSARFASLTDGAWWSSSGLDLGRATYGWKDGYFTGQISSTGNITTSGNFVSSGSLIVGSSATISFECNPGTLKIGGPGESTYPYLVRDTTDGGLLIKSNTDSRIKFSAFGNTHLITTGTGVGYWIDASTSFKWGMYRNESQNLGFRGGDAVISGMEVCLSSVVCNVPLYISNPGGIILPDKTVLTSTAGFGGGGGWVGTATSNLDMAQYSIFNASDVVLSNNVSLRPYLPWGVTGLALFDILRLRKYSGSADHMYFGSVLPSTWSHNLLSGVDTYTSPGLILQTTVTVQQITFNDGTIMTSTSGFGGGTTVAQNYWLEAGAWTPPSRNAATLYKDEYEYSGSSYSVFTMIFSSISNTEADLAWFADSAYDSSDNINIRIVYFTTAATAGNIQFQVISSTAQNARTTAWTTTTLGTFGPSTVAYDVMQATYTYTSNQPVPGSKWKLKIRRDAVSAADTSPLHVYVTGIDIQFKAK